MSRRRVTVRAGALSLRADLRVLGVLAIAGAAILAAFTVHVGRGEFPIAPPDVLAALVGGRATGRRASSCSSCACRAR